MKRAAAAVVAVILTAALAAQAKPNFTGTWVMDPAQSDPPARMGGPGGGPPPGGPGGPGMGGPPQDVTLVIKQTDTELVIERKTGDSTATLTYKFDGSEVTNPGTRGETKSRSRWEGSTLVTESTQSMSTPRGDMTIQTKEVRSLDATGQVMTVQTTTQSPRGETTRKTVFKKSTT
jgi:hypothetical protein